MGHADFTRPRDWTASYQSCVRYRVVRRAERSSGRQARLRWKQPCNGMDAGSFEAFFETHGRQDRGYSFREPRLTRSWRADEKHDVDGSQPPGSAFIFKGQMRTGVRNLY